MTPGGKIPHLQIKCNMEVVVFDVARNQESKVKNSKFISYKIH